MIDLFPSRSIAIEFFGFAVHWYGILYALGAILAIVLLPRIQRYRGLKFSHDDWTSIVAVGVLGVILGGRLGYVFFYEPLYFMQSPLEIIAVWHGGMSSHGGFIGVGIALGLYLWKHRLPFWNVLDVVVIPVALALALGRIGNFLNQELYGTVTTLPWGIEIPGEEGLRHPTQIYAFLKNLLIAGLCFWHLKKKPVKPGQTLALFLVLYGVLRFFVEFLRVQQYPSIEIGLLSLTRGQLLTVPIVLVGIVLFSKVRNSKLYVLQ